MSDLAKEIIPVNIEAELKQSYLAYAMSVIVGRALPDVRDGLKPVHRRVLFAMNQLGNDWNKPHKKSARIVGDVIGKYHPHGESAVYDTIVRMAQTFSMRVMLVDGQGNFGSVDGDSPAAMRYTEVRMSRFAHTLLADLEKETVDFELNYDETEYAPVVMPTRAPHLLINGSSGIAVGMATNIPPHNLGEIIDACLALIEDPQLTIDDLFKYVPGPDFPTAGIIYGRAGIIQAYRTGRGRIHVRGRAHIESFDKNREAIIVTELPFQVNKARLLERIAELVKEKLIEGITELRDESDKDGMRMVIEVRRGESAEIILNHLYTQTQMQSVFGINMVALVDGRPQVLNLKQILACFLKHRREVVTRRSVFELRKARERAHILEGLGIALANIDEMIAMIKASATPQEAREQLLKKDWQPGMVLALLEKAGKDACRPDELSLHFGIQDSGSYRLSQTQAQAILDLRLHRLTGLEQEKIMDEYQEIINTITNLLDILSSTERLQAVIRTELEEVKQQFFDVRRTEIVDADHDFEIEDLIAREDLVVTFSHQGYAKTQSLDNYEAQRRGGRGKMATAVKEEDFVERLLIANTHDTLLCFSSIGKVYWLKVYKIPQAARTSRGKPVVNLLPLGQDEKISAVMAVKDFNAEHYVFMATALGTVKKVPLVEFSRPRSSGIIAINLQEQDRLIAVAMTHGQDEVMLFSDNGKVIRFNERDVRAMGRTAGGVRGMRLNDYRVISLIVVQPDTAILTAVENGYGKRTAIDEYRVTGRGGQGVISIQVNERNGRVVGAIQVKPGEQMMLITDKGTLVRTRVDEILEKGRNTQGVLLIRLQNEEKLKGLVRVEGIEMEGDDELENDIDSAEGAVVEE